MIIKGNIIYKGYSFGKAFILKDKNININKNRINKENIECEILRFKKAYKKTINQFKKIKSSLTDKYKKILFEGYIFFIEDKKFKQDIINNIKNNLLFSDYSVHRVVKKQINDIKKVNNPYIRERANDYLDIKKRLIYNIYNVKLIDYNFLDIKDYVIIVSKELSPSQIMQFNLNKVVGYITEFGSITSHTSIISKSLELVSIIQVKNVTNIIYNNDNIIIDGIKGNIYVNPSNLILEKLKNKNDSYLGKQKKLFLLNKLPAVTTDGYKVKLLANINSNKDIENIFKYGAEGIGLYRTEFLFMNRDSFPTEEEQYNIYKQVIEYMDGKLVTIRTVDLSSDKFLPYMKFPKENIPFLGWKSIRIYKDKINIFHTQLRAILRSSIYGNVRIIFPMIISMEEVFFLKKEINKIKLELKNKNISFNDNIKLGVMIETPAAAIISEFLAKELDFFSIGTNDLIQYTLAVDRNNILVSYLYEPLSPSIIHFIKYIIFSVHKYNKKIGICGEIASDENITLLLVGLGIDELSMNSNYIPKIKYNIRSFSFRYSKNILSRILNKNNIKDIKLILKNK